MGPGWGGTLGQGRAKSQKPAPDASPKSLLFMPFRVVPWTIVAPLAGPVTPEVAGSSPVAPVKENPGNRTVFVLTICLAGQQNGRLETVLETSALESTSQARLTRPPGRP